MAARERGVACRAPMRVRGRVPARHAAKSAAQLGLASLRWLQELGATRRTADAGAAGEGATVSALVERVTEGHAACAACWPSPTSPSPGRAGAGRCARGPARW
jgi:hypothetical protein